MAHDESKNDQLRAEREALDESRQRMRDEAADGSGGSDDQGSQDERRHEGD